MVVVEVGGGISDLVGDFAVVVVEVVVLELVVRLDVRLVWTCLNGRTYVLWCLSLTLAEANISNVSACFFRMVLQADFLSLFLFLDNGCLGKMMSAKVWMEVVIDLIWRWC